MSLISTDDALLLRFFANYGLTPNEIDTLLRQAIAAMVDTKNEEPADPTNVEQFRNCVLNRFWTKERTEEAERRFAEAALLTVQGPRWLLQAYYELYGNKWTQHWYANRDPFE